VGEIFWGASPVRTTARGSSGELVLRDGETFYRISNYHTLKPFLVAVVSGYDHWMYVSSTGGLSCGRRSPELALFPYYTDDKIHDACSTTGPLTVFRVEVNGRTFLWKPFGRDVSVYAVERNLYKSRAGNKLIFEEVNHDLGLGFSYAWSSSDRFGFVRKSKIWNVGSGDVEVEVLDGLRNLLPYGLSPRLQSELSTLGDAYKQAEAVPGTVAAIYSLSSILTDRAEPSEALKATVVWSTGLGNPEILLSEDQVDAFCSGSTPGGETIVKGKRGAFFVRSSFRVSPGREKSWHILADVNQGPSEVPALLAAISNGGAIEGEVEAGTRRLIALTGGADGCQMSSDALATGRHFSNTLFNIMRGGTFYDEYRFPVDDFLSFVDTWNRPLRENFETLLGSQDTPHTRASLIAAVERSGDATMERIALEYLPLIFSRRHGDPSRPWNQFSIDIREADGSDKLYYQGNWRDIFQNWEALAISFPEFAESFITKFVNASTADGHNPYRITKDGFEWEILNREDPWSNIGYWGDHQVNYLLKLLEFSRRYHPGKITSCLTREVFVYADVPYRLKDYQSLLTDPRNSVEYDAERADLIAARVEKIGSDGKLLTLADGSIYSVTLLEKLLVTVLAKIGNFAPGGGIWMNTQRPEWNDANNALVGYGLSMVTLCYLRRFLVLLAELLDENVTEKFSVSLEVAEHLNSVHEVLRTSTSLHEASVTARDRKVIMDQLGAVGEVYRHSIYSGFSGKKRVLAKSGLLSFIDLCLVCLDNSIAQNRRADCMFHSYNLIHFGDDGYVVENLCEMLEGQVAVLSSGYLGARETLDLLDALRASKLYRSDQNSYLLYPYRKLPLFREKNVLDRTIVENNRLIQDELESGRGRFIEQDVNGDVHFNGSFRNSEELRAALDKDPELGDDDKNALSAVYETVFQHRQFTGRSGAMYKYEGLGCIYWHMVSKLLLATSEVIAQAARGSVDQRLLEGLIKHYDDIKEGLGINKTPAQYGAFPLDPYSHTPAFAGVQQPGMTGQVKEDIITRFFELGVNVDGGEIQFTPVVLKRSEFLSEAARWRYSVGGAQLSEELEAGSLAFSLCGAPVIYRLAENVWLDVVTQDGNVEMLPGNKLGTVYSQSLFRREKQIRKIIVNVPESVLR